MKTTMLGFLAETAIHCGAGRSAGIIDIPVAREAATDYPFIAGSGLKGALRDRAESLGRSDVAELFGKPDQAGRLLVSDARLLLLPVRSLTGAYRWVTCPLLLERYGRDLTRCGLPASVPVVAVPKAADDVAGALAPGGSAKLYLEEREFSAGGECPNGVHEAIAPVIRHEQTRKRLAAQTVVLGDDEFAWFCRYALPIQARNQARNVLKDGTKRSMNLWYEESLPPDTVLYALVMSRDGDGQSVLAGLFPESDPYLQVGGNETVGHGWVAVSIRSGGGAS
jgi:CRISPR-associated protein Cmr4